jgi:hypothetical protein
MPTNFRRQECPLTQLTRPLTPVERDGTLARETGIIPRRMTTPGRDFYVSRASNPASVHHVWPMPAMRTSRPMPRLRGLGGCC